MGLSNRRNRLHGPLLKSRSLLQPSAAMPGSTPWEQAAVILFLLSDDASNITGALYATDGGWTAY